MRRMNAFETKSCPWDTGGTPCRGFTWDFGQIICSKSAILSIENCRQPDWGAEKKVLRWSQQCNDCWGIRYYINQWQKAGQITSTGLPVCKATKTCPHPAVTPWAYSLRRETKAIINARMDHVKKKRERSQNTPVGTYSIQTMRTNTSMNWTPLRFG
ncbi:hypothetical protein DL98DRAFT_588054 [Cadophora sp. DSE1049]|nr:hypothetical protein DL98DRAFT_588054 [Cadophora sp. DSE1049]